MIEINHASSKPGGLMICIFIFFIVNLSSAALSDTYELSEGDLVAIQLNAHSQSKWQDIIEQYDAPFLAYYDQANDRIIIQIYGTKERVEDAKQMIDRVRKLLVNDFIPYLKNIHEIDMNTNDIRMIYRNRTEEGMRKILIWEHGKFKFPINE